MSKKPDNKPDIKKLDGNKNKGVFKDDKQDDFYPGISSTASSGEMTGLMYKLPENEAELEAFKDLSNVPVPKDKTNETRSDKKL